MANSNTVPQNSVSPKIRVVTNCTTGENDKLLRKNCYKIIANWIKKDLVEKKKDEN